MASLEIRPLERGLFEIRASYFSKALNEACKLVPGMRWSPESKNWYGYSDAIEQLQEELSEKGVHLGGELPEADVWKSRCLDDVNLKASNGWVARQYQEDGVRFGLSKVEEGCLIADGMRLGKSAQACLVARPLDVKTLVICPPNAVGVWAREPSHPKPGELAKWWPESWGSRNDGVVVLEGVALAKHQDLFWKLSEKKEEKRSAEEKKQLKEADVVIQDALKKLQNAKVVVIHDQIIYAWVEVLLRWGYEFLICDEIHWASSYDTRRSVSAKKLGAAARYRLGLSGTPMTNRPRDLHNVVDLLCPGRFGAFFRHERQDGTFSKTFCGSFQETVGKGPEAKTVWNHNGKSNVELLHRRLSRMMLRRTAKEVDKELPDKVRQVIDVRVPANKMVMPSMSNLGDRRALRRVLDLTADAKLRPVLETLKSHLEEGLKVVAFCHRQIFAETLVNSSTKFSIDNLFATHVHGEVTGKKRIERIINSEKHQGPVLFAATIESCSSAIDLSFADVIVFCELVWEPAELAQCLDAKTEILTPYGFVPMGTIRNGDEVAAFNVNTEEIAYLKARNVVERPLGANERMFGVKSSKLDIRVTDNHRMLLKHEFGGANTRRWTGWVVETAQTLAARSSGYRIPTAGYKECVGVPLSGDELRVIGWYLTDGSLNGNTLSIGQSVGSRHIVDLERSLRGAGFEWSTTTTKKGTGSQFNRNYDQRIYHVSKFNSRKHNKRGTGWYRLSAYLDKNLSPLLSNMTREQLAVMLEAIHWGDGKKDFGRNWTSHTYHITTGNRTFADRLQQFCIERGFRANVKCYVSPYYKKQHSTKTLKGSVELLPSGRVSARMPDKTRLGTFESVPTAWKALRAAIAKLPKASKEIPTDVREHFVSSKKKYGYTINIGQKNWRSVPGVGKTSIQPLRVHRQPGVREKVWCVTNDWGTLVVRRNGYVSVVGNCEERSYKLGDGRKRFIQYIIARGTGDELILRSVISKLADFEAIVGSTGDRMRESLQGKKDPDAALKRLQEAMEEMHKARPVKKKQGVLSA